MILYSASKAEFRSDVSANRIEQKLLDSFLLRFGRRTGASEVNSWRNSLMYMSNVLEDDQIPSDSNVAIEYKLPNSSKRVDLILTGRDHAQKESLIIVELKQWTEVAKTELDGIVSTQMGGSMVKTSHPSYQAWTYASLLKDFNSVIQDESIGIYPCAYLHNCLQSSGVRDTFYQEYVDRAPLFLRDDFEKLQEFIKKHVKYGDTKGILYKIDNGKIRPSKGLAESLSSMLKGNREFLMIDDQKLVFETALQLSREASAKRKKVLIVEGGPGSGKSVVAINLLVEFTRLQKTTQYITKNAAPRAVYEQLLTGSFKKSQISNFFSGSGSYYSAERNTFDTLIVDEAHRLNEKSGLFSNKGENQVSEIIRSSLFSVFFLDENQKVTLKDIGTKDEITRLAAQEDAEVYELTLSSQYRCNGSDAYLAWLDRTLQIKDTANTDINDIDYDFRVFDDPVHLRHAIELKNAPKNSARLVAGYCWPWLSKKNPAAFDIVLNDDFKMQWNLTNDGSGWIIQKNSVNQVGCIHTCQGLEVDYVGVIIGPDLTVRNDFVMTDGLKRASGDQSIKGFKKLLKENPSAAKREVDLLTKNTYRTLMTRGSKGCYIYCTDPETRDYFRKLIGVPSEVV